jgi:predicted HTH transcriptional regulator
VTFGEFKSIIENGEKATVDFKLNCNAFNKSAGDHEKARAELVKDICAMANNGPVASFLIIGVGDDRHTVHSVTDPTLTDENVHTLVRDAINPRPRIRLLKLNWKTASPPFRGKTLVVIQVGPNARYAFRLAQDKINWEKRFHFRKNEVWVRNGSTSDLATPEQVHALVLKRKPPEVNTPDLVNVSYAKLTLTRQVPSLRDETAALLQELGGKLEVVETTGRSFIDGQFDFVFN